ncbi:MAG: acetate--CoA ligase family protein [Weeksellaceae bacterium]
MSLKTLFEPKSIAIVGVSQNPQKVGHLVAKNMIEQGFKGDLYFVHPSGEEILGKKTHKDLISIGQKIDLVIIALPAKVAVEYFAQIRDVGCQHIVLFAAGFKEIHTPEGDELEKLLKEKIAEFDLRLLGPNCIGFVNTAKGVNATFFKYVAPKGNIGIISQSGALGSALIDYVVGHAHLGFSHLISLGNKTNIDESETLEYLAQDENTKVIGMYLEDVTDGPRFREVLAAVTKRKPVVILKAGRTTEGSQAAVSHTGSMVGDDAVFNALCEQAGAIRALDISEFTVILELFSRNQLPTSRNMLVLSNAGGMGVLLADELIDHNLHLVTVSEETKSKLHKAFDDFKKITVHNPIDLLGDASAFDYEKAIQNTQEEHDVGGVIVLLTPQANTEILETAQILTKLQKKYAKEKATFRPIYPVFMGERSVHDAHEYFEQQRIGSFRAFELLVRALEKICWYRENAKETVATPITMSTAVMKQYEIQSLLLDTVKNKSFIPQHNALKVMDHIGLQTIQTVLATSENDLKLVVQQFGYPLVAKTAASNVTHKTEVKGVITNINSWKELTEAYQYLAKQAGGCYIQKQYSGYELIIGAKRDPLFGPVILVGFGGIYAELLHETIQFVIPVSYADFLIKLHASKLSKFVTGYRNMPILNAQMLYSAVSKLAGLMDHITEIKEIDINPLMMTDEGMIVVDARVIV